MIRQLLRRFKHQSPGELAFREMLASDSSISDAIYFQEVGLPSGKTTTIQWWISGNFAVSRVAEQATPAEPLLWQKFDHEMGEFKHLLDSIHELDMPTIENFTASVRDGGHYHIAWGDRDSVRSVIFQVPLKGDRRKKLVELIKLSVDR